MERLHFMPHVSRRYSARLAWRTMAVRDLDRERRCNQRVQPSAGALVLSGVNSWIRGTLSQAPEAPVFDPPRLGLEGPLLSGRR
jgi:hypothetical protein